MAGCFNFRDLGGYRTGDGRRLKWRRLFRADGLTRLDADDCAVLAQVGLKTVIDLRTDAEANERGRFPADLLAVRYHHLPLLDVLPPDEVMERYDEPSFVTAHYHHMVGQGTPAIVGAITTLAEPGALPAVFHCSAGKDRTGVLAALLLAFLGVPADVIVEDYALSGAAMVTMLAWLRQQHPESSETLERLAPAVVSAPGPSMAALLDLLAAEYGSFDALAERWGLTPAVARLRSELLEA
jgi:protein-tyrosine phosphatase